jgi:hypothetical protein
MHLAADGTQANGIYRAIVRENPARYSISSFSKDRRYFIRRGLEHFNVRPVERVEDLLKDGYDVYASWSRRTGWATGQESQKFNAVISRCFQQSRCLALGAYIGNKLAAFVLPCRVGNVVMVSFLASHSDHLKCFPNDALFHSLLSIARQSTGVDVVFFSGMSIAPSQNAFKLHYGTIKQFPSYTWINPVMRPIFDKWVRPRYPSLSSV